MARPPTQSHLCQGGRVPEKKASLAAPENVNGDLLFLPREKQLLIDFHSRPRTPNLPLPTPPPGKAALISLPDKLASGLALVLAIEVWRREEKRYTLAGTELGACVLQGQVCLGLRSQGHPEATRPQ